MEVKTGDLKTCTNQNNYVNQNISDNIHVHKHNLQPGFLCGSWFNQDVKIQHYISGFTLISFRLELNKKQADNYITATLEKDVVRLTTTRMYVKEPSCFSVSNYTLHILTVDGHY